MIQEVEKLISARPTLIIGEMAGGMISEAHKVCNFPSYYEITGMELTNKMVNHVKKLGVEIKQEEVKEILIRGNELEVTLNNGQKLKTKKEAIEPLTTLLKNYGVAPEKIQKIRIEVKEKTGLEYWLGAILPFILPFLLIVGFIFLLTRQMQNINNRAMSFGQSSVNDTNGKKGEKKRKVTFKDVAGAKEAKEELQEVVGFLKNPKKFTEVGAKIPKGVLLIGPPGTGKTLMARAVSGEANVPFFHVSGSEFVEMFVGVGASVTGDTPILIRKNSQVKLVPIKDFVDQYYEKGQENFVVPVKGIKTLGFQAQKTNFRGVKENSNKKIFFGQSSWQDIKGVFRHKVGKIYEIHYLGGVIKTTGDHSIFVRERNMIKAKKASQLKEGDILVNLPFKVRGKFIPGFGTTHKVKAHEFSQKLPVTKLRVWDDEEDVQEKYEYVLAMRGKMTQSEVAQNIGMTQGTVYHWQAGKNIPKVLSWQSRRTKIPEYVDVSPELFKLFGYYTAEGRGTRNLEFTFGLHEKELHQDVQDLMKKIFKLDASLEVTQDNTLRIKYYSAPLGRFFSHWCGNSSHNKHIPGLLWDLPKEYFLRFLEGYFLGDGYTTSEGKLSVSSVSHQLIREISWLAAMHGIKVGVRKCYNQPGRVIKNRSLPGGYYWNLIIGKTAHPFEKNNSPSNQFKKPYVKKIIVKEYNDYVYDLCGVENEAFFGGEKPILLHNSRVRSLFQKAKKNAPCVPGDTQITLSDGKVVTIKEMYDKKMVGVKVPSMKDDYKIENAKVIAITRRRKKGLYQIKTIHSSIKATENHQFPVLKNGKLLWIEASKLKKGDYIASPRKLNVACKIPKLLELLPQNARLYLKSLKASQSQKKTKKRLKAVKLKDWEGKNFDDIEKIALGKGGFTDSWLNKIPKYLNKDLLYLAGLIKADGTFVNQRYSRSVNFINTNLSLHKLVSKIVYENFNYQTQFYLNKKHYENILPQKQKPKKLKDCYTTCINNKLIRIILEKIEGLVLELPEDFITSWLRGFFDGDGCVSVSRGCPKITFSVWEKNLNQLVRNALLRVGIVAYSTDKSGNIEITGKDNMKIFIKKIGSRHPEKVKKLKQLKLSGSVSTRLDALPVGNLLKEARLSVGMSQRQFKNGHQISAWERGIVVPVRKNLQRVTGEIVKWCQKHRKRITQEIIKLKELTTSDVIWTRIVEIQKSLKNEYVYDLCLNDHHNFVANNIFVHNCIVFIDELDAIGRQRGAGLGGSHDEREQTLNQILVEMDGFEPNSGVIVLAATNRPDILDAALLRPGRFDRRVTLDLPDINDRMEILQIHAQDKPLAKDVDLRRVAERTPGFSGADLANLMNEAAILAAKRNRKKIRMEEILQSIEKVMLGPERKSRVLSEKEKKITAHHEAGHALVAHLLPHTDPVQKVSIIARGMAGGYTLKVPQKDRHMHSKSEFLDELSVLLAGHAAEKEIFGEVTTGAQSDLKQATKLARKIVTEYGMSEKLGPRTFGEKEELVFLGREISEQRDYSEKVAQLIDEEVSSLISGAYEVARGIIKKEKDKLKKIVDKLLEKETLEKEEFEEIVGRKNEGQTE